jgi:hypothetical protein
MIFLREKGGSMNGGIICQPFFLFYYLFGYEGSTNGLKYYINLSLKLPFGDKYPDS